MIRAGALALLALLAPSSVRALADDEPALWQERFFFDALLSARDRAARGQSDPQLLAVMKAVATQAAQQTANLGQISSYVKAQEDNLKYAFRQEDPAASLATIQANFDTLAKGAEQIRHNLYYLTARCRMASSQALPDQEMYNAGLLILGQIQQIQLDLNTLYTETVAIQAIVLENKWATSKFFKHKMDELLTNVVRIQDSVFAAYNSGYELTMRCK